MQLDAAQIQQIHHHHQHHTPQETCQQFHLTERELGHVLKAATRKPGFHLYARGLCTSPHYSLALHPDWQPHKADVQPVLSATPTPQEPPMHPLQKEVLRLIADKSLTRKQIGQRLNRHPAHEVLMALDRLVEQNQVTANRDKTYRKRV